jgi:hypothetical protein
VIFSKSLAFRQRTYEQFLALPAFSDESVIFQFCSTYTGTDRESTRRFVDNLSIFHFIVISQIAWNLI